MTPSARFRWLFVAMLCVAACGSGADEPAGTSPAEDFSHLGLSDAEAASLLSLEQIDDHPLYTMQYSAEYGYEEFTPDAAAEAFGAGDQSVERAWACSLFVALADPESQLFGRNFDWMYSPAVLLFTDPPDGYAAAALVDIAFLGFEGSLSLDLADRPLDELVPLLSTPHIPFDGLNETGLAIAMAAVDPGDVPVDPDKETIGSLGIMRLVLDKAATVEEAVDLIGAFNINFEGGPPLHYLVADADGNAALVEFHDGEMVVVPSEAGWHQATNFVHSAVESPRDACWRYDRVYETLESTGGVLDVDGAMDLLGEVAQPSTQWSVVYDQGNREINLVMRQQFDDVHTFELTPS